MAKQENKLEKGPENEQAIVEGSKLVLECEAKGRPPFSYKWSRDNKTLPDVYGNILEVSKATKKDQGMYMCTVTNDFNRDGYSSSQLKITVGMYVSCFLSTEFCG